MLSIIGKKIIISRLADKGIMADFSDFEGYFIDAKKFDTNNQMYDFIVENWKKLIIE